MEFSPEFHKKYSSIFAIFFEAFGFFKNSAVTSQKSIVGISLEFHKKLFYPNVPKDQSKTDLKAYNLKPLTYKGN